MSISPQNGARGTKDTHIWNITMQKNGKVDSLWGSTPPKIRITSKKGSYKCCLEMNFVQKSPRLHMSICLQTGARGLLERLI